MGMDLKSQFFFVFFKKLFEALSEYENEIHKEMPSFFKISRRFKSSSTLEVSIKDLFGLSKAFDIVAHKTVKKLLTCECHDGLQIKEDKWK